MPRLLDEDEDPVRAIVPCAELRPAGGAGATGGAALPELPTPVGRREVEVSGCFLAEGRFEVCFKLLFEAAGG